ncbi:extensin family protein [Sphingomonas qomolangmaensis]|uniref:Extensin family protein n=1 Tax=Sphingomonas qomolangmaensis TaxID=2918765 RepID=A0ABY5L6U5_9SPHN|nr:extensin family protein [Sphingomonas qomolangmaensis]UUL82162.1 extensin family protein [Sphingomonas qomolangmaensis]
MRIRSLLFAATLPALLAGCVFDGGGDRADRRSAPPRARASAAAVLPALPSAEALQCQADLNRDRVEYRTLPNQDFGGGCMVIGAVQLLDIGVPVAGLKSMRCPLARNFSNWVRYAVAPAARQILDSDVVRIESYGTFACRPIAGSARLSEHGRANAVDVAVFVLADGRRVSVLGGWEAGDDREQEFLRTIHQSACKRFTTVLGPDYNAAHANHFHFDMAGRSFCR